MLIHIFRGVSSGASSNYALKKTATENREKLGNEAAETLKNNFYVDGLLKFMENEDVAVQLIKKVQ